MYPPSVARNVLFGQITTLSLGVWMNMIKTGFLSLLLAVSCGTSHNVLANEITIATFHFETEQVNHGIKVMTEIYRNIGYEMKLMRFPSTRSLVEANLGTTQGELMRIKEIQKDYPNLVRIPYPISSIKSMALTLSGQPEINNVEGLLSKRVGVLRGLKYTNTLTQNLDREILNSIDSLFAVLLAGRVDVILFPELDAQKYIKSHQLDDKVNISTYPIVDIPLYHFVHKDSRTVIELLNKKMSEMNATGALATLIDKAKQSER
ncbi:MAG: polar amino acid transport system substrate-binding protein [Glaciecola sp.]|jgi:polar amino acid transport system substrate-binding protein